jgi:hypothetical protein
MEYLPFINDFFENIAILTQTASGAFREQNGWKTYYPYIDM